MIVENSADMALITNTLLEVCPAEVIHGGVPDFLEIHQTIKKWFQQISLAREFFPPILPTGAELTRLLQDQLPPDFARGAIRARAEMAPIIRDGLFGEMSDFDRQLMLIGWRLVNLAAIVEGCCDSPSALEAAVAELFEAAVALLLYLESAAKTGNRTRRRASAAKAGSSQSPELKECKTLVFREVEKIRKRYPKTTANALGVKINTLFSSTPKLKSAVDAASLSWDRFPANVAGWVRLADKAGGFKNLPQ